MPNHHTYRFDRDMSHGRGHDYRHGGHGHSRHSHYPGAYPILPPLAGAPWWIWPALINNRRCC